MPGIKQRQDGRFEIRKMVNGTRKSFYANTMTEAKKIYKKLLKNKIDINKKEIEEDNKKNPTLTEWILQWEEIYKKPKVTEKTFKDMHNCLKEVFLKLGNKKLTELKTIQIQMFLNNLKQNRTKEKIELYLNNILQKAEDTELIDKNPFKAIEKSTKGKYKNICFNFEEQKLILDRIKNSTIEHEIMTYLIIGCRPAELPTNNDFNFEYNYVSIKGTKNINAKRNVDISIEFSKYMKDYLKDNKMKTHIEVQKIFKKLCRNLNINKLLLYRLRHTFASNHFAIGTPAKQVSAWMGHSTITITLDTYTDIDKSLTKEKILNLYNNYYITPKI